LEAGLALSGAATVIGAILVTVFLGAAQMPPVAVGRTGFYMTLAGIFGVWACAVVPPIWLAARQSYDSWRFQRALRSAVANGLFAN